MAIVTEAPEHRAAVRRLHLDAFPTSAEADLVERIRSDGDAVISLVALRRGSVVGHALLSRMSAPFRALGLAPVSVDTRWRRRGIAAALIEEGVNRSAAEGFDGIFVLGDPRYYCRFGFSVEAAAGFESRYAGPYLMLLALEEGGPPALSGRIDYAPAFRQMC